ncbi:MAG TPA: tetratricopeptide repeat protein [Verrucomicrobiae bacterium]|nr:tetratricopeptide repeat protein [Verrucomicrobiae bacterium]
MNRVPIRGVALALCAIAAMDARGTAVPLRPVPVPPRPALALARDPSFQKAFLGTYGSRSDVEPFVATEEKTKLDEILNLMGTDLRAAGRSLIEFITPQCSAKFDFLLGNIYFQVGDLDRAGARFYQAIKKFPNYLLAHRNLGLIHSAKGRHDLAIESLSKVVELGGADAAVYGALGQSHLAKANFGSAEAAFRSASMLEPGSFEYRIGMVRAQYDGRKFSDVVVLLDELLRKMPEKAEFWMIQANAYIEMKQPMRAAQDLEIVEGIGKGTVDGAVLMGNIYVNEGLVDMATVAFERAIDRDPAKAVGPATRAVELLAGRKETDAARRLVDLIRTKGKSAIAPEESVRLQKVDARLALADGASDEAARILEGVIATDPMDGEALMLLGQHYAKKKEIEKAMLLFERAGGIESLEAEAKLRHAQLLVGQQRYADAIGLLKRAAELKPNDGLAKYIDQVERAAKAAR